MSTPVTPDRVRLGGTPLAEIARPELERRVCALIERTLKAEAEAARLRKQLETVTRLTGRSGDPFAGIFDFGGGTR